jgi:hypothetical protein
MKTEQLGALIVVTGSLAVLTSSPACGTKSSHGEPVDSGGGGNIASGGAAGGGGSGYHAAGGTVDIGLPLCPNGERIEVSADCGWLSVSPDPDADPPPTTAPCELLVSFELLNINRIEVRVDCELVPRCDAQATCWDWDSADAPTTVVLSEALCAQVQAQGYTRIDITDPCAY